MDAKRTIICICIVVETACLFGVTGTDNNTTNDTTTWGKDDGHCRIGWKGFPTTAPAGDLVQGSLIIENTGREPILLIARFNAPLDQLTVDATLNENKKVDLTSYGKGDPNWGGSVKETVIEPEKKVEVPFRLSRIIDMTRIGTYWVKFRFSYTLDKAEAGTKPSTVSCPHLKVQVEEPKREGGQNKRE